ncbi:hypothetical protein VaNZ11_006699 [Volvox africanus]|uniref:FAD dependent oxidoreductase domain-containing protein n=1 Tax=Volvox africanus TaxID=51714 RepID=A0ABQ5S1A4_9CHLO|nr:hypothetical protein VaNZ11_006699 [Volvox africanus]
MRSAIPHHWRITRLQPCATTAAATTNGTDVKRLGATLVAAGNCADGLAAAAESGDAAFSSSTVFAGLSRGSAVRSSALQRRRHDAVHYAVVGAGLAGVATAWQLMRRCPRDRPVVVDLYDAAGIAAGGSGAAAGLLHPYNPRGKLLWRGEEAMAAAMELVDAAEAAMVAAAPQPGAFGPPTLAGPDIASHQPSQLLTLPSPPTAFTNAASSLGSETASYLQELAGLTQSNAAVDQRQLKRFVWTSGLVRPAANAKQAADFAKAVTVAAVVASGDAAGESGGSGSGNAAPAKLRAISTDELQALVPGIVVRVSGKGRVREVVGGAGGGDGFITREEGGEKGRSRSTSTAVGAAVAAGADGGNLGTSSNSSSSNSSSSNSSSGNVRGNNRRSRRAAKAAAVAAAVATHGADDAVVVNVAGLLIPQGMVLDVGTYLRALWRACQVEAEARGDGSLARLRYERVESLERLRWWTGTSEQSEEEERTATGTAGEEVCCVGQYDAVVVAAGAAAATIKELKKAQLPLQLCQGLTLVMQPPLPQPTPSPRGPGPAQKPDKPSLPGQPPAPGPSQSPQLPDFGYPADSPSLLGQPYMAAQGPMQLVVGATKSYGWTPEEALAACGRSEYADKAVGEVSNQSSIDAEKDAAVKLLRVAASDVWAPLVSWRIATIREGVRALPPRTSHGSLPLLGRLVAGRPWWLVAGLGSRGLVYHGWLAQLAVDAVLCDSDEVIPKELTAWRGVAAAAAVFEAP